MTAYTYDDILERYIGKLSLYQILLCTLASLDALLYNFYTMSPVFIANIPPHRCSFTDIPPGSNCSMEQYTSLLIPTVCKGGECEKDSCHIYSINDSVLFDVLSNGHCPSENSTFHWNNHTLEKKKCSSMTYEESFYTDTTIKEWDLVCDAEGLGRTISGAYMFGRFAGCLLFTPIADIIGRRKVMLLTTALTFAAAFVGGFATNVYWYIASRFALGVFDMCRSNTGFILGIEYIHRSKRSFFAGFWSLLWVLGYVMHPGIAYLLRSWRHLQIFTTLPEILIFLIFYFALPESPRWLLAKDRIEDAKSFIIKLARCNKKTLPDAWEITSDTESDAKASFMELLRAPRLRLATFLCSYIFFASSFLYYGLSMNTAELAGNTYWNFFLFGLMEAPAYLYILALYNKTPRLPPFFIFTLIGGIFLLLTIPIPNDMQWLVVVLALIGKFAITVSLQITWQLVTEIFPTPVRGCSLGITNSAARFGSFVSTYVLMTAGVYKHLPTIIYGVVPLIASGLILLLPETRGISLFQTVDDGEQFLQENMCRPCRAKTNAKDTEKEITYREENGEII